MKMNASTRKNLAKETKNVKFDSKFWENQTMARKKLNASFVILYALPYSRKAIMRIKP